jgi:hypothetical protein
MSAFQPARDQQQRRFHIQMMFAGKLTRLGRNAVPALVTTQPKAIA